MPNLMVRNVPGDVYERLVASAKANRRSLTQETISLLERILISEESENDRLRAAALDRARSHAATLPETARSGKDKGRKSAKP